MREPVFFCEPLCPLPVILCCRGIKAYSLAVPGIVFHPCQGCGHPFSNAAKAKYRHINSGIFAAVMDTHMDSLFLYISVILIYMNPSRWIFLGSDCQLLATLTCRSSTAFCPTRRLTGVLSFFFTLTRFCAFRPRMIGFWESRST